MVGGIGRAQKVGVQVVGPHEEVGPNGKGTGGRASPPPAFSLVPASFSLSVHGLACPPYDLAHPAELSQRLGPTPGRKTMVGSSCLNAHSYVHASVCLDRWASCASDVCVPTFGYIKGLLECLHVQAQHVCAHVGMRPAGLPLHLCSHALEACVSDNEHACLPAVCTGACTCVCTWGRPRTCHLPALHQLSPPLPNSKLSPD